MFFSLFIPGTVLNSRENLGLESLNVQASGLPVRLETEGEITRVQIGSLYGFADLPLSKAARRLRTEDGFPPGRFLFLEIDRALKEVRLFIDKYRLLGVRHELTAEGLSLSNSKIEALSQPRRLDSFAQDSLRKFGAVLYPYTLVEGLAFLSGHAKWNPGSREFTMSDHALAWPEETVGPQAGEWTSLIAQALADQFDHFDIDVFRMSGGVDSRLIAHLLPERARTALRAQALCHPRLSPTEDRDVVGARMTAESVGMKFEALTVDDASYLYLGNFARERGCFSGLYGGEFLGGLMYIFSPWLKALEGPLDDSVVDREWKKRLLTLGRRKLTTEVFLNSFRSMIYGSVSRSWAAPSDLNNLSLSPFVEQTVLDGLLSTPFAEVENYRLYAKIFRQAAASALHLPLSSDIVVQAEGFKAFEAGTDPKSLPSPTEKVPGTLSRADQNLFNFVQDHPSVFAEPAFSPL